MNDLTHASFFSGAGGTDIGLERAGWRTVSFSEVEPYANAVLAERWPAIPNLGDIEALAARGDDGAEWARAILWSGGFPCQDLSIANSVIGGRRGFGGARSVLAFAFLDLVERYRPPAILLENVAGLLSSHSGRDFFALQSRMAGLGYGVAWRLLDAQHFGVPQLRRRVFILGLRSGPLDLDGRLAAERAAEILSVGTRCGRHPPSSREARTSAASGLGAGISRSLSTSQYRIDSETETFIVGGARRRGTVGALNDLGHHGWSANAQAAEQGHIVLDRPPLDAARDGAADGLAGRVDDRERMAFAIWPRSGQGSEVRAREVDISPSIAATDGARATDRGVRILEPSKPVIAPLTTQLGSGGPDVGAAEAGWMRAGDPVGGEDELLPPKIDEHRYRCCGNGVVAPVAEWIGRRLAKELE